VYYWTWELSKYRYKCYEEVEYYNDEGGTHPIDFIKMEN